MNEGKHGFRGAADVDLGRPADYSRFPASVVIDGTPYWLVRKDEEEYSLLLSLCPHAGGDVLCHADFLYCPMHGWTFSPTDGRCLDIPGERLMRRDVELRADGRLYAFGEPY
jgi:nitrite reductase/ring-hydroxylating ferredoxin subunit